MTNETRSQGEVTLITVWAEDSQGNRVEVNPDQAGFPVPSGKATHVKSDTWEIELEEAGLGSILYRHLERIDFTTIL